MDHAKKTFRLYDQIIVLRFFMAILWYYVFRANEKIDTPRFICLSHSPPRVLFVTKNLFIVSWLFIDIDN